MREAFYVPPLKSTEPTGISEAIDWHAGVLLVRETLGASAPSTADAVRAADALKSARAAAIRDERLRFKQIGAVLGEEIKILECKLDVKDPLWQSLSRSQKLLNASMNSLYNK